MRAPPVLFGSIAPTALSTLMISFCGALTVVRASEVVPPEAWNRQISENASGVASMLSRLSAPWMCMSRKPGERNLPRASRTASPDSTLRVSVGFEISAMRPSRTRSAAAGWMRSGRMRRAFLKSMIWPLCFLDPSHQARIGKMRNVFHQKSRFFPLVEDSVLRCVACWVSEESLV